MPAEVNSISLSLPFKLGSVNCYLIKTHDDYILIDTGCSNKRADLEKELVSAGCQLGHLTLIVITHGDFDHIGNAAYLRQKFGAKIAMHADDVGMAERGDMFWNRKKGNRLYRSLVPKLFRFGTADRFQPDVIVGDGTGLTEYGFDAKVISIPGHSKGSISILTSAGDLFCGDLLENAKQPAASSIVDDIPTAQASIEKLANQDVKIVYPGHGKPFPMKLFLKKH